MTEHFDEECADPPAGAEVQPCYTVTEPAEANNDNDDEVRDLDEVDTMNAALSQVMSDEDISSPDISESDTTSEDTDNYHTAREDRGRHRRGRRTTTTNYSATSNKQSSVKKDKKSVIQVILLWPFWRYPVSAILKG